MWTFQKCKNAHACALRDCLGVSRPFVSDTSPKCIDREGLVRRRIGTRQSNTQLWRQNYLYVLSRVDAFWRKTEILLFVTLVTLSSAICNWNENRGLCLTQPATTNIARQRVSRPTHPLPTHTPWACCHWQISTAAGLAHSVERLTAEREVAGSILVIPGTGPVLRVLKITEKWRYCLCLANG